jgi:RNase P subunit RPR2
MNGQEVKKRLVCPNCNTPIPDKCAVLQKGHIKTTCPVCDWFEIVSDKDSMSRKQFKRG